ncbi:hypothetical protein AKO1_002534 [Acrasis kona]|uniref:Mut7-C RNAse domain-containing protein n=1 Tax=Acrasis kona TaxID=1008807 RepID=A0AAW2ZPZ4_9EUKA
MTQTDQLGNDAKYIVDNSLPGIAKHLRVLGVDILFDRNYTHNYVLYLARKENRIIITGSIKSAAAIDLIHKNHALRQDKLKKLNEMLENAKQNNGAMSNVVTEQQINSPFLFEHEVKRKSPLTADQILEKIEMVSDDLEDETNSYHYNYYHVKVKGRDPQLVDVVNHFKLRFYIDRMFSRCTACNGAMQRFNREDKEKIKAEVDENTYRENDFFAKCTSCNKITWGTEPNPRQRKVYQKAVTFCEKFSYHPDVES